LKEQDKQEIRKANNDTDSYIAYQCEKITRYVQVCLSYAYANAQTGKAIVSFKIKDLPIIFDELKMWNDNGARKLTDLFLKKVFQINSNVESLVSGNEITFSWECDNKYLRPKPVFNEDQKLHSVQRNSYFESLFDSHMLSDITIEVEGEKYPAHKIILA